MGAKNGHFLDFEKVEKISGNFREILGNFSKIIAGHKTPNFLRFEKALLKHKARSTMTVVGLTNLRQKS